jgi:ADP-ribosylglycohydrolase
MYWDVIEKCYSLFSILTEAEKRDIHTFTQAKDVSDLKLGSYLQLALQSMGFAIVVLRKKMSLIEGLELAVKSSGDTKGNSIIVCAILGALYGF